MEFSDHECLKSQRAERCSVKCLSLPVPVRFYQEDLTFAYMNAVETAVVSVNFPNLCP